MAEKVKVKIIGLNALKRRKKKLAIRIKAIQRINPSSDIIRSLLLKVDSVNADIKQCILNFNSKQESEAVSKIKSNHSYVRKNLLLRVKSDL